MEKGENLVALPIIQAAFREEPIAFGTDGKRLRLMKYFNESICVGHGKSETKLVSVGCDLAGQNPLGEDMTSPGDKHLTYGFALSQSCETGASKALKKFSELLEILSRQ